MIWERIGRQKLTTDHFTGKASRKGKTYPRKRELIEHLTENSYSINSHTLKLRLIKAGMKEPKCEECGMTEWRNKPIPIELDHINGNHYDNRIENLRILCPNCHAQTDTYCGKKIKIKEMPKCAICDNPVNEKRRKTCGSYSCVRDHTSRK